MKHFSGLENFLLIWFGQIVSSVGSRLSAFALGIWVLQKTGSTTQFALIFVFMAIPAMLVLPIAGALVDRWDRRKVMICCDLVSGTTMATLATLLFLEQLAIWHIYAGVGLCSLANAFHSPAYLASIPLLSSEQQLPRVNGMVQTADAVALIAGPLLAGVLVSMISMHGVLFVDAISFFLALLAMVFARIPRPPKSEATEVTPNLLKEAATGWHFVRSHNGLFGLLMVFGVSNFLFGIASILITPLVLSFTNPTMLGIQFSIGGIGLLLGGIAMTATGGFKRRIHGVLAFYLLAGLALTAHGLAPSFVLVASAGFLFFLSLPVINASSATVWQSKVPAHLQGRCFAIQRVLSEAAMPVGFCLAGPLAEHVFEPLLKGNGALVSSIGGVIGVGDGRGTALIFIVLGLLMSMVAILAYSVPAIRTVEDSHDPTMKLSERVSN